MRLLLLLAPAVHAASWFASSPAYARWSHSELRAWLEHRHISVPPSFDTPLLYDLVDANWNTPAPLWSPDQLTRAQRAFAHVTHDSFDKWDESRLRAFLLDQGVVAPSGPRDQLVLLARDKYRAYTDAVAHYSSLASASASSAYADATDTASQSISSAVAQATRDVVSAFDDSKDYVYSAWDDNRLRSALEELGVVEAKRASNRQELTRLANNYYRKASIPVWESWSDSYIREWLVAHKLLRPTDTASRSTLLGEMKKYYYSCTDNVWSTWSESELKAWLVEHGFLKSDAQKNRDALVKMVEDRYSSALDSVWGAWSDSDIRQWLSERGHLEGRNAVTTRQDLVDLINSKYTDASAKSASYLVWPDARLRAYLRERGVSESALPTNRPGLLQETRIRWVQTSAMADNIFAKLKKIVSDSVEAAEAKLARVLEVLSGNSHDAACYAYEKADDTHEYADTKKAHALGWGSHKVDQAREKVRQQGAGDEL